MDEPVLTAICMKIKPTHPAMQPEGFGVIWRLCEPQDRWQFRPQPHHPTELWGQPVLKALWGWEQGFHQ